LKDDPMRIEDYPPQEPLSENGVRYTKRFTELSASIPYEEYYYASDAVTQGIAVVRSPRPNGTILAWMHGGGWTNGYKELMLFMGPALARHGVTFVSMGYRLAPATTFPDNFHDAARATALVHAKATEFGADPARLFVAGWSAGGQLAALLATRREWTADLGIPSNAVRGCITMTGIFDFTVGNGMAVRPRFLGPAERAQEFAASPLFHGSPATPPMLLTHGGEKDFPHLVTQAVKMEQVLRGHGVDVERVGFPPFDHFTLPESAHDADGEWVRAVVSWLEAH
jgi:arylformamidase